MRTAIYHGYKVFADGRIYSPKSKRFLKTGSNSSGYRRMTIRINGRPKSFYIHHIILECFSPKTKIKRPCCRHLDGNKLNNDISNLKWGTYRQNIADKITHGTHIEKGAHYAAKLSVERVVFIRASRMPLKELAKKFSVSLDTIRDAKYKRTWK